ncbi:MAG: indolepyruvate ferredoxin oxidoreductase subunit alpha [Victivallales bacterium]|jgi:indolepyruvate ferredoxin oxidoreductase alpha subunit|nr:indolepyruvate ferredoxin oxidoreductase subunit alpha [Victivallales bacterium]
MKELLSGNEAIARGAWEAGVKVGSGYPGTPSTEILENLVKFKSDVYCEWSPNEKVALEVAAGAAVSGVRSIVTMKHVGLNVAADPLMTLSYIGIVGGMVIVVADDPGMNSSQTEQDTRHYGRLAKVPVLEPGNAREAIEFVKQAFDLSEKYRCPVILRSTTSVSHSRALVEVGERITGAEANFKRNPSQFVPLPIWGRKLRLKAEERVASQIKDAAISDLNRIFNGNGNHELGIISGGIAALHCRDIFPEADILKLGWAWPFPDELLKDFAGKVKRLLIIEEADPIIEEHVKSLGITCEGKTLVPRCGELTPIKIREIRAKVYGEKFEMPLPAAEDLPGRPPILCAGCPHRGIFFGLAQFDVIVTGDIGCYSLGVFPPLSRTDIILCMGGGFSLSQGMVKAGEKRPLVGVVGDSTFFHSGITGLLDIVYNQGNSTLIVVDNRTTAMTGHQDHPGTGQTLMGEPTVAASIEKIAEACGMKRIRVVNPYHINEVKEALNEELSVNEPSLIISRAPCILKERKSVGQALAIDSAKCRNCKQCLKLGCPAIETAGGAKPKINAQLCIGCTLCQQLCKFGAISELPPPPQT